MSVYRPFSFTSDWTRFASSARTKFSANVEFTILSPASTAKASSVAQYFPSRYSSTYTGTVEPNFSFRTSSLRTTLPAKTCVTLRSSASVISGSDGKRYLHVLDLLQFNSGRRVHDMNAHDPTGG